jgi:hypothetical protein
MELATLIGANESISVVSNLKPITQMTDYENNILNKIEELINEGKLSNTFLVLNLKLSCDYLNLQRISDYSKDNNITTQGVLRNRKNKIIKICNYNLIYNNE